MGILLMKIINFINVLIKIVKNCFENKNICTICKNNFYLNIDKNNPNNNFKMFEMSLKLCIMFRAFR